MHGGDIGSKKMAVVMVVVERVGKWVWWKQKVARVLVMVVLVVEG